MFKRKLAAALAVICLFGTTPTFAQETADYIALGDSIASGYGLPDPGKECYPSLIADEYDLVLDNESEAAMTSKELLAKLQNGDYDLSGASLITVSVGSNDIFDYVIAAIADELGVDKNSDDLIKAVTEKLDYLLKNESRSDTLVRFSNIEAYLENNQELSDICGELTFKTMPAIAAEIKKQNPDAQVIFTNIYNPYKNMDAIMPISGTSTIKKNVGKYCAYYVDFVNKSNNAFFADTQYTVADVESVFDKNGYVNAHLDMRDMTLFSFDPHPTRSGQNAIKTTIAALYIPSEKPEPTPEPPVVERLYGDVNFDKQISSADSAIVLQYTLNKGVDLDEEALIRADVTGDGNITSADSAQILQKALVSSYKMPVEEMK